MSPYWQAVLTPVLIDTVAVLGLYVTAMAGRISVAQASFMGIGGYTAALLAQNVTTNLFIMLGGGLIVAVILGGLFAIVADRLDHWFFAVATLAFGLMVTGIASASESLGGATGLYGVPLKTTLGTAVIAVLLTLVGVVALEHSALGRRIKSVRDSSLAAAAFGINVRLVRVAAFAISAGIAGVAGVLHVSFLSTVNPGQIGFDRSLLLLVFLAIGGTRSWLGPIIGTLLLGLVPELLRFSQEFRYILFGIVLVIVMTLRPNGVAGTFDPLQAFCRWVERRRPKPNDTTPPGDISDESTTRQVAN